MALFRVPDLARLVEFLAGDTDVGRCRLASVPGGNSRQIISKTRNFTPRLRYVVFVGKPTLCLRLDIKRIALRAVGGADQFVVGLLRLRKPRLKLRCSIGNDSTVAGVEFIDRECLNLRRWSAPSVACRRGRFVFKLVTAFQLVDGLSLRLGD